MKTLITTFAFALMVFAFNTNPVMAGGGNTLWSSSQQQIDELKDADESEVAIDPTSAGGDWFKVDENGNKLSMVGCVKSHATGQTVCCYPSSSGAGVVCHYPNATDNESRIAWQVSIPSRPKGNNDSVQEQVRVFAGIMDYCNRTGNCMMLDENNESEIAKLRGRGRDAELRELCAELGLPYPCVRMWWNEDAESKDGFGGRDIADSGNEGSTSAASADDR